MKRGILKGVSRFLLEGTRMKRKRRKNTDLFPG